MWWSTDPTGSRKIKVPKLQEAKRVVSTDPTGGRKSGKDPTGGRKSGEVQTLPEAKKSGEAHGTNSLSELAVDLTASLGKGRGWRWTTTTTTPTSHSAAACRSPPPALASYPPAPGSCGFCTESHSSHSLSPVEKTRGRTKRWDECKHSCTPTTCCRGKKWYHDVRCRLPPLKTRCQLHDHDFTVSTDHCKFTVLTESS